MGPDAAPSSLESVWPLYGLRVRTPRLELRIPTEAELPALIAEARQIHGEGPYPFSIAWSQLEEPAFSRGIFQYQARIRADFSSHAWDLPFSVFIDGAPVGAQSLRATDFPERRSVDTGSWVARRLQGQGIGTEMRHAILHFAFAGLGAAEAHSSARIGNDASARVSRSIGYRDNGTARERFGDEIGIERRFLIERDDWEPRRRDDIEIVGLDACLDMFAISP